MAAVCAASAARSAASAAALPSAVAADAERVEKEGSIAVPPQATAALQSNVIRNRFKGAPPGGKARGPARAEGYVSEPRQGVVGRAASWTRAAVIRPAPAAASPVSLDAVPLDGVVVPDDAAPRAIGSGRLPIHDPQRLGEDRGGPIDVLEPVRGRRHREQ